jgi:2-polyprenyl-3-methyl-5-hydroxy-6-metoxy-1,4-benzoquinol methylase
LKIKLMIRKFETVIARFFEDNQKFLFHPQFIVQRAIDTKVKSSVSYFAIGSKILDVGCGSGPY